MKWKSHFRMVKNNISLHHWILYWISTVVYFCLYQLCLCSFAQESMLVCVPNAVSVHNNEIANNMLFEMENIPCIDLGQNRMSSDSTAYVRGHLVCGGRKFIWSVHGFSVNSKSNRRHSLKTSPFGMIQIFLSFDTCHQSWFWSKNPEANEQLRTENDRAFVTEYLNKAVDKNGKFAPASAPNLITWE